MSQTAEIAATQMDQPDSLLACLEFLTRHYGRPQSAEVLKAGLPLPAGRFLPSTFIRAAERAGFVARAAERKLADLDSSLLPAVVILAGDAACVLLETRGDTALLMLPAAGGVTEMPRADLAARHTGAVLFLRPDYRPRAAVAQDAEAGHRWFWDPLLENSWLLGQVALAAVLTNIFALAAPLFTMTVYDRVVPNQAIDTLWVLAIGISIVFAFDFIIRSLRGYFIDIAGSRADVAMASRIFDRVLGLQLSAKPASAGAFAGTLREFETVRDVFTSATMVALVDLPFILLFIVVIWLIGGPLVAVPLIAVPVVLLAGVLVQGPLAAATREGQVEAEAKSGVLFETLGGLETIKAIGADTRMRERWEGAVVRSARIGMKSRALSLFALNFAAVSQQAASAAIVVLGVLLIGEGRMTVGALIAASLINGRAVGSLAQLAQVLVRLNQARTAFRSLDRIMQLPVERPASRQFLHRPLLDGKIEFRDVTFAYPGQSGPALKGASFTIQPGERVGLIGRVGSGKSTVQKLILGLYQAQEGAVLIDGTDIRQIDPIDLRRNIGAVPQESFLFRGTLRDNITAGNRFAGDDAVLTAARLAGVDEFASRHPMGYDMPVGERGETLSGGQRQAIAVARALLGTPGILLMDEPSSSMDNASESQIKANLTAMLPGRTLVLVTHRASLLSLVDRLIVLDHGAVAADGPKQKVLEAIAAGGVAAMGAGA